MVKRHVQSKKCEVFRECETDVGMGPS
jgi:hypothetical protein